MRTVALAVLLLSTAHAALIARPSALPQLQRLRGGALPQLQRLRGGAAAKPPPREDPGLKPQFVAQVISWAVLPTVLRLAYAALTLKPPPPAEPAGWFRAAAPAATAAAAASLPYPDRWQFLLALAWVPGKKRRL